MSQTPSALLTDQNESKPCVATSSCGNPHDPTLQRFFISTHSDPKKNWLQSRIIIMAEQDQSPGAGKPEEPQPPSEHLNIKVTDNNNEVFFKIKRTTALKKLMDAFCDRQGKAPNTVRFLFDGVRVGPEDSPNSVS